MSCVLLLACLAAAAAGADRTWDGGGDGVKWFDPNNWDPNGAPDVSDALTVLSGSPQATVEVRSDGGGSITVDGPLASASFSPQCYIGGTGSGTMSIANGGQVFTQEAYVGGEVGSTGTVTIRDANSTWTNTGYLSVGEAGNGTLNIHGAGRVESGSGLIGWHGGTGQVSVLGAESVWEIGGSLSVATGGVGALSISEGGRVESGDARIGGQASSDGQVVVCGAGSTWHSSGSVHVDATGSLSVADGGLMEVDGTLELQPNGTLVLDGGAVTAGSFVGKGLSLRRGTLTVVGGSFDPGPGDFTLEGPRAPHPPRPAGAGTGLGGGHLTVGSSAGSAGTLRVDGGSSVQSGSGSIGQLAESTGTVLVRDASVWNIWSDLNIGQEGYGTLVVANGGYVSNTQAGNIGLTDGARGEVIVRGDGSEWNIWTDLNIGQEGYGTLVVANGGYVSNNQAGNIGLTDGARGEVIVRGDGSEWNNGYAVYVGKSGEGALTIADGGSVSTWYMAMGRSPGSEGEATVRDRNSHLNVTFDLHVGREGNGMLTIADGAKVESATAFVATEVGTTGVVTVRGADSRWDTAKDLEIGAKGSGTLTVADGGRVDSETGAIGVQTSGTGEVTVRGADSRWDTSSLYVGGSKTASGGTGTLTIADGGRVGDLGRLKLWPQGTVTIDGGTICFASADPVEVAGGAIDFRFGTVAFDCSMSIDSGNGTLAGLFGSPITIRPGKCLHLAGAATLATPVVLEGGTFSVYMLDSTGLLQFRSGTLRVWGGVLIGPGELFDPTLVLRPDQRVEGTFGAVVQPLGELRLRGGSLSGGRVWNEGLITGSGQIDSLRIDNFGEIEAGPGERLTVTGAISNPGRITLAGGALHCQDALSNTGSGLVMGNGMLRADLGTGNEATMAFSGVANVIGNVHNAPSGLILATGVGPTTFYDDVCNEGEIRVSVGSTAVYLGTVDGNGLFTGDGRNYFEGDLSPGFSPGRMTFEGEVAFGPGAGLAIELAGTAGGEFDQVVVGRRAALRGTLALRLGDSYAPDYGDAFDVLLADPVGGRFDQADGYDVDPNLYLGVLYEPDRVRVVAVVPGDADLDGDVDAFDYLLMKRNYGRSDADWADGDFHANGQVDLADYCAGRDHFGWSPGEPAPPGAAAVPEPATLLLLAAALPWLRKRDRRR